FFQAEDGIRDKLVTGVQTCALPICRYRPFDPYERGGPFEGAREFRMPPVPRRFWGGVAFFALAVLIFVLASPIVSFVTELQWYDSLGYRDVYTTRVWLQVLITLGSFVLAFAWLA